MIEMGVRRVVIFVLALASVCAAPGAAERSAETFQIVAGTWVSGSSGRVLGPAWWLDGPTATFGATVVGADSFKKHIGGPNQRYPGMPSTRSLYWCNGCNAARLDRAWYAIGDDQTRVPFSIEPASRLAPLEITSYTGDAQSFSATWTATTAARSFIAYVQAADDTSATHWIAGSVLPAAARTITFDKLALDPNGDYAFNVFAFSGDITGDSPPAVFNVASSRVDFVPVDLTSPASFSGPVWSPDAKHVAWITFSRTYELWVASADLSNARVLARNLDAGSDVKWLRDGRLLWGGRNSLFTVTRQGSVSVFARDVGGFTTDRAGTLAAWVVFHPSPRPSIASRGGGIVVKSLEDGSLHRFGGRRTRDFDLSFSPDGSRLAFARVTCRDDKPCYGRRPDVWLAAIDGGGLRRLVRDASCPAWSPDGKWIAYLEAGAGLALVRSDGTGRTQLGSKISRCEFAWSPDSKHVAFGSTKRDGRLVILDLATKRARTVSGPTLGYVRDVDWSRDSAELLVTARSSFLGRGCSSLWLVRADGSGSKLLGRCRVESRSTHG